MHTEWPKGYEPARLVTEVQELCYWQIGMMLLEGHNLQTNTIAGNTIRCFRTEKAAKYIRTQTKKQIGTR
jgi:hypothetical protein